MDSYKKCCITNIFEGTDNDIMWKYVGIND